MFNYITIAIATASLIASSGINYTKSIDANVSAEPIAISAQNPINLEIRKPTKQAVQKTYKMWVTAYTSRPEETDDTPFITASGNYVHDGVIATNYLPMGTLVRIPEYFGDKIFRVEDRMHERFDKYIDVWFSDLDDAKKFGKRYMKIEVL